MRPLRSGVIVISFLTTLALYSVSQQNVADVVKQSSDAVVLIVISNSAGQETALGSGFLVSADGEIVTNYHVIEEAHSATVKLSNGAFFPVSGVLAAEADKDLAVIKVNGKNLPFLSIGDIDKLHIGDHVVAIGSPLGLEGTVCPEIRCDNGPELTSRHFLAWCVERQIELLHIQPGKPTQNARVESFHGRLRDECLTVSWFQNLFDARRKIAVWRVEYNEERPHSSLGYRTPKEFAAAQAAAFYTAEREARDSNAVPCPSRSPIPAQIRDGVAESCRILT